jgi:hypothetical protein
MHVLAPAVLLDAPPVLDRPLDAVDVLVLNTLAEESGARPVTLRALTGDAPAVLSVSMTAAWAIRNPEEAEQVLLGELAPCLVTRLVGACGEAWLPEAEVVVDLALTLRLEELASLPVAVLAGRTGVDGRDVTDLLAPAVHHPQTVWLV